MLEFKTEVRLNANAGPDEIAARLAGITAPPYSFVRVERRKPLRGKPIVHAGFLRWPLTSYRVQSARNLKFDLLDAPGGSVLVGAFTIWSPLRVVVLLWLGFCVALWGATLIRDLYRAAGLNAIGHDVLFLLIGWCMASGYLGAAVLLGRERDRSLIRVLRVVLASESGAHVVTNLLSSDDKTLRFVDAPMHPKPLDAARPLEPDI